MANVFFKLLGVKWIRDRLIVKSYCKDIQWQVPEQQRDLDGLHRDALAFGVAMEPKKPGYKDHPALKRRRNVPKGTVEKGNFVSHIYPETNHRWAVYLPAGYKSEKEYPLLVILDGVKSYMGAVMNTPVVMDNLIADGKLPPMLVLFLDPGDHGEGIPGYGGVAFHGDNRSLEYDSSDDTFARFLDEELLPELRKRYSFTSDPDRRAIFGGSSGAVAALATAWWHPDSFRKVMCYVPSFTGIRDGYLMQSRIRQEAKKPLRIIIGDGERDLKTCFGDWVLANQEMVSALEYRGYEYRYSLEQCGHLYDAAAARFPDDLIWLFRDVNA